MSSSGTYNFAPSLGDLVLEAYSRAQIRPASLTAQHMQDARMSANLLLSEWSTEDGPNLWKEELLSIPLTQGVATYSIPANVVAITSYYIRQFMLGNPVDLAPAFSTTSGSTSVGISQANHGLSPGEWMAVVVPVSIGGLILLGFYQVTTVIDANNYTITAASNASATASGGVVPSFTSTLGSATITVDLPNHGLFAQQDFSVQVPTVVGSVTLSGVFPVVSVIDANHFTITGSSPAGASETVSENGGQAQLEGQLPNVDPIDRVIFPISQVEYAAQPDKAQQAYPTSVFFWRLTNPTVTLWPVPDQNGPYVLYIYAVTQVQDAVLPGGVTMDLPYRFFEAFAAGLAAKLAWKYPPPQASGVTPEKLDMLAQRAWGKAAKQDTEQGTSLFVFPALSGYFR